ncbi:ribonuclease H-like domain-containing protein [Lactarius pseudohatsudake]|nr:ribonuclease H-like domain-containing protein [Lactarius pseudohatsudake]
MLLNLASTAGGSKSTIGKGEARVWNEVNFLEHFGSLIVEPMDQLFECASKERTAPKGRQEPVVQHAPDLPKLQLKFKRKVDNTNGILWSPTLRHKFNTRVPLGYTVDPASIGEGPGKELCVFVNHLRTPTATKSTIFPILLVCFNRNIPLKPFDETHLTWSREIAIDLEYHSYRTYSGFACLVQTSTCDEDWIVDPFELRDELEVFTNPSIVKARSIVLRGANSDVVWLQQDFNLYSVNMFDTFDVSRVLDFPRRGLAAPLPLQCARANTHFLLYVYDNLRNALLDRAVLHGTSPTSRAGSPTAPDAFHPRGAVTLCGDRAANVLSRSIRRGGHAEGGMGFNRWDTLARRWNKLSNTRSSARCMCGGTVSCARRTRVLGKALSFVHGRLSNRFVFKLVEQPPADMHAFLSTPLVVRRRAKDGPAVPSEPTPAVSSEVTPESRRTLMFPHVSSEPAATSLCTTSSRFGVATVLPRLPSVYSTSQGSLFGFPPTSAVPQTNRRRLKEATAVTTAEAVMTSAPDVSIDGATTEIPFVPAALRQTVKPEVIDDAIVVIGQRQKKRKHEKKAGATDDDDAERSTAVPSAEAKAKTVDVVPFDFASAPNMLDEGERNEQELGSGRGSDRRRPY